MYQNLDWVKIISYDIKLCYLGNITDNLEFMKHKASKNYASMGRTLNLKVKYEIRTKLIKTK